MNKPQVLSPGVQIAVIAIILLGMLGGSLIVAHSGFATSSKRGGPSVFVPAPQAYLLAATMYGMSVIGMVALIRSRHPSHWAAALGLALYVAAASALAAVLAPP